MAGIFQFNVFQTNVFQVDGNNAATTQDEQVAQAAGASNFPGAVATAQSEQIAQAAGVVGTFSAATTAQSEQVAQAAGFIRQIGTAATAQSEQVVQAAGFTPNTYASTTQDEQQVTATGLIFTPSAEVNHGGGTVVENRVSPRQRGKKISRFAVAGAGSTEQPLQIVAATGQIRNRITAAVSTASHKPTVAIAGHRDISRLNERKKLMILMALEAA